MISNKREYQIFTDTSCDLTLEELHENDIGFISYLVNAGGDPNSYVRELVDMPIGEFYDRIRDGNVMPKTSMPSIGAYTDEFKKALDKGRDILCITLTSKFSGSFSAANNAKIQLAEEYPDRRITVIDSRSVAGLQGAFVMEAVRMKNAGLSMDENAEKLMKMRETQFIYITVDSLKYLQKGGRIGKVNAFAGSLLNIKPLIVLKDGELVPFAKIRGRKKTLSELITLFDNDMKDKRDEYYIVLLEGDAREEALQMEETLKTEYGYEFKHEPFTVGMTIGAHIGPTVIGLGYIKKYEFV